MLIIIYSYTTCWPCWETTTMMPPPLEMHEVCLFFFSVFFVILIIIYSHTTCWEMTTTMPPPLPTSGTMDTMMTTSSTLFFILSFRCATVLIIIYSYTTCWETTTQCHHLYHPSTMHATWWWLAPGTRRIRKMGNGTGIKPNRVFQTPFNLKGSSWLGMGLVHATHWAMAHTQVEINDVNELREFFTSLISAL